MLNFSRPFLAQVQITLNYLELLKISERSVAEAVTKVKATSESGLESEEG